MISDLVKTPLARTWSIAQRVLIVAAVALVVGAGAVGTGRTLDEKSLHNGSVSHRALKAARAANDGELLHDVSSDQVLPSLALPETITRIRHTRIIEMEVTAYCACRKCCGPNAQGITASGKLVSYNDGKFVAADTSVLPFGTKLLIPGYDNQTVEVIDRGGAIKGNKLDVFYASHQDALVWGRQKVLVTVVE